ncbi:hypothetical protein GCM10027347_59520 [Larkinella harenae]
MAARKSKSQKIKQLGLAFKEGWSWIIYPIIVIFCFSYFEIDKATVGTVLTGLSNLAAKYLLKPK